MLNPKYWQYFIKDIITVYNFQSQISSQHPYAEEFIGKPYVWTVDVTNKSDIREAVKAILRSEVVLTKYTKSQLNCMLSTNLHTYYFPKSHLR